MLLQGMLSPIEETEKGKLAAGRKKGSKRRSKGWKDHGEEEEEAGEPGALCPNYPPNPPGTASKPEPATLAPKISKHLAEIKKKSAR